MGRVIEKVIGGRWLQIGGQKVRVELKLDDKKESPL